uniref:F-box domain-containing protein n=1 Tax=Ditylenchus dipsaci TaxID=166011 RepID=A0A915CY92_9BILA
MFFPSEILCEIFSYSNRLDLTKLSTVNKEFKNVVFVYFPIHPYHILNGFKAGSNQISFNYPNFASKVELKVAKKFLKPSCCQHVLLFGKLKCLENEIVDHVLCHNNSLQLSLDIQNEEFVDELSSLLQKDFIKSSITCSFFFKANFNIMDFDWQRANRKLKLLNNQTKEILEVKKTYVKYSCLEFICQRYPQ